MSSRSLAGAALVCCVCLAPAALGQPDEPGPALKARVKQLVEQLGDRDPARQVAASKELLKLGPKALPHLPGPDAKLTETQSKNLAAVTKALREAYAQKALAPRLVTIQDNDIPLSKALAEIARQTDVAVEDRRTNGDDPKLKLNLKDVTFWQALDAVAREADARINPYRDRITLADGPHREVPVSYHGIFRVAVKRIAAVRDLEADAHFYVARVEVAWEPRFRPFLVDTRPKDLVIKDDKDRTLPAAEEEGDGKAPAENPLAMTFDLRLPAPQRSAGKLSVVKGNLGVVGASKMMEFIFDPLDKLDKDAAARQQTREGVTVRLGKPVLNKPFWTLEVSLEYPPDGPEFESFQSWLLNNEIYLWNEATNQRFPNNGGYATDSVTRNRASVSYHFVDEKKMARGKPSDWKVVYRTPGAIVEVPVPFEFKDLPLP